jgi:predicted phosphodiesterase
VQARRVAALYDVHGNLPALEAVLAEVREEEIGTIVVGGDVLWGPFQRECVSALRAAGARFVAGNCERTVLAAADDNTRWSRQQLDTDTIRFVAGWPSTVALDVDGLGHVLFCHATPRSDEETITRQTSARDLVVAFADAAADVVVCGHTHVQYDRGVPGGARVVNAGSVGLPYQGEPGAYWAILGPAVELRRTSYDVEPALETLLASGFPSAGDVFPESLRGSITAESATEHFEAKRRGA